jgi:N-acetylmuramic acid 6-phosphate etherase
VIVGAGASGRAALQTVSEYTPEEKHSLVGLIAGGSRAAGDAPRTITISALELQAIRFSSNDMLLALTVSGKRRGSGARCATPGRWARQLRC